MMSHQKSKGLGLLEMLVALFIMSLSIAMIYKAIGGSARGIGQVDASQGAVMLASSLLDAYSTVDQQGLQTQGQDGIYTWQASSNLQGEQAGTRLHVLRLRIQWDGRRELVLDTLRPERVPAQGVR
ncbi:type II secretion system protein [Comamonas sp.]|uniref:type II secretion system protein n=1 Tax=Comamonas sp. TaxID=34028 RepID=UPI0025886523|nr:type II secretion system protein [Comamonas sp.]